MSKILFIMWVSGSGHTTVVNELLKTWKFIYVPSYTTRQMRIGEKNWEKYLFITKKEFEDCIKKWEFLEYAFVHELNYYWTKNNIIDLLDWDKIPIKEIDIHWLKKIIDWWNLKWKYQTMFFYVPEDVMIKRIVSRSPITDQELQERLKSAKSETKFAEKNCDWIIDSSWTVEETMGKVKRELGIRNWELETGN